jgi:hypothetical protein
MGRRVSNPAFGRLTLANACFFLPSDIHHYYIVTTTRDTSIYVPRAHKSSTAFEHCMNVASVYNDCFALHRSLSLYRWMLAVSPARSVARHVGRDVIRDLPFTCIYAYEERERELHKAPTASQRPPSRRRRTWCCLQRDVQTYHARDVPDTVFGFCQVANPGRTTITKSFVASNGGPK